MAFKPNLHPSWCRLIENTYSSADLTRMMLFVRSEAETHVVYPPMPFVFECFNRTPVDQVKVVIIGQDPYHGFGQAHGLSFSVQGKQKLPPSLKNILNELQSEFPDFVSSGGDLSSWAEQGVLLMNAILTVRESEPGSHHNIGWELFTDTVINQLSKQIENIVFLLWGKFAQSKIELIDHRKHLVLQAPHPSPFSAYKGFFGCKHFSKTNKYLIEKGYDPIDWNIN